MNVSILYETFRYLTLNFEFLYCDQLIKTQYTDSKLSRALKLKDIEIIKIISHLVNDIDVIKKHLVNYAYDSVEDNIDLIESLLSEELIHTNEDIIFRFACKEGNVDVCRRLLVWKPHLTTLYCQPLCVAMSKQNTSLLKLLISVSDDFRRIFINPVWSSYYIRKCVTGNKYDLVKLFIDFGGDITKIHNLLNSVCECGHYDIFILLVESGINLVNINALESATRNDSYKIVKYWLENVEVLESIKRHLLDVAITSGALKITKLLFDLNIRPNKFRIEYYDANDYDMKQLLLEYDLLK